MAPSKWNVQLISTDHDLNDLRRSLLQTITGFGFHAVGFEQDDFRVEPGVHSHEACVESIKSSDIVVLVIDRRFGGAYLGSGDLSVTEVEYNTACENGKIVIPCIRNKAEQERFEFFGIEKTYPDV